MVSRAHHAVLIATSFAIASAALAGEEPPAEPPVPVDGEVAASSDVDALAKQIVDATTHADRMAAVDALTALGPEAVPAMAAKLVRKHVSSTDNRRAILKRIKAHVPDNKGKFRQPGRTEKKTEQEEDAHDWLAELEKVSAKLPGYREIFLGSALIRALAATRTNDAATAIVDFGFTTDGLVMRDECGRYLRKMEPYSLPSLIIASQLEGKKDESKSAYAVYQLERLDRQNPNKAVDAASDDDNLRAAVLMALSTSGYREGVHPVIRAIDDPAPIVRAAARKAWMGYVTGPEPPLAPRIRLKQPHDQYSKNVVPEYLNYRELATYELHELTEQVFGRKAKDSESLEQLSQDLFDHYDAKRAERVEAELDAAFELADSGELEQATAQLDLQLVVNPTVGQRDRIAGVYAARAAQLENAERWREAAVAYGKAHGVDPDAESANSTLANHHFALGKALESEGKDGSVAFARAKKLDPQHAGARRAVAKGVSGGGGQASAGRPKWMLYAGIGGGAGALLLLVIGLVRRKS